MTVRFNPASGWPQNGRAFNHGIVAPEGRTLYITGQVAWDGYGLLVGKGECEAQIRQCFDNVESILASVGGRLEDIVSLTIFFLNPADLPAIQKVRAERFTSENAPASILIQTPGLVSPELLVELVPIAVIPHARYRDPAV
ncbi:RidA family protein [Denitrobaculum tricleocarpae]|uniref:RidA family protein n=1 Tax=Denitrobaculum tricleocarpae TaxID=2591009 RepID=A0A545TPU8_9PROT|nr:RidA family protein [Denitrobaculum tricleocarpae]TQV79246.1 RidA family protein [Denitrobaculum tricleocarpae]